MNKDNKLGMGLGALLSTNNKNNDKGNQKINISQIAPRYVVIKPRYLTSFRLNLFKKTSNIFH